MAIPAAARRSLEKYGARTRIVESAPVVATAAPGSRILANNPNRLEWFLSNGDASNFVMVTRRRVPTTTFGARVNGAGGSLSENVEDVGEAVTDEVRGIADTANVTLYVYEIVADEAGPSSS